MERFFGSLKSEWTDDCRYQGFHDASKDIAQFIEWEYNANRGHTSLEGLAPAEV
jgi:transposase InsO family protein